MLGWLKHQNATAQNQQRFRTLFVEGFAGGAGFPPRQRGTGTKPLQLRTARGCACAQQVRGMTCDDQKNVAFGQAIAVTPFAPSSFWEIRFRRCHPLY